MRIARTGSLLLLAALAAPPAAFSQQMTGNGGGQAAEVQPTHVVTHHSARIGGRTVEYDATLGSVILRDDDGNPTAEVYYTAYTRSGVTDMDHRPLTFAYNGGPGSSSVWLHMGALGPKRVATPDTMHVPPPPYDLVDNQYSILDVTDLVMIDPVGTGLSRPVGDAQGRDFWGVDEDAASLAQFVTRFLSENDRWNSPRYLLGESYGTTRSAALGAVLQGRSNVDLNGIILVSAVLDFQTITFNPGNDIPYFLYLPSYTAVAFYHHALPDQPAELQPLLDEAEHFAVTEYADALLQGDKLTGQARQDVLQKLHRYTGLSVDYLDAADLRVDNSQFEKELMRETGVVLGRLDARFTGFTEDGVGERADFDPQSASVSSAYASSWNRYLRDELGYEGTRDYRISGNVNPWNWQHGQQRGWPGHTNVAVDLARAMRQNPTLHVMLNSGLHDLATPYFAADYTMDHLGLPPELRGNVERVEYEAGHMMYLYEPALARFKTEVAGFIQRTSDGGGSMTAAN